LPDIQNTQYALRLLQQFASQPKASMKPFFLAVGFYKPHISLKYPKEFLDLYPFDEVPIATDSFLPLYMPTVAYEPWTDIRSREDIAALNLTFPYGPMPELYARKIRQSYYAATSYIDSLVGELLEGIQKHRFSSNTVVVVVGDHGELLQRCMGRDPCIATTE
jgi:iduronate 2-sulfatase